MSEPPVEVERDDEIAIVSVVRPDVRNAMDVETRVALRDALEGLVADDDVRGVVLRGGGDTFISGSDVRLFLEMDPFDAREYTQHTQDLYNYVEGIPKPVVAAIDGYAMGGGLEIALCCDVRVATEEAKLGQSELAIGAIPGGGGTQRLPDVVGMGVAKELMFTGDPLDAERARELGLVNRVVAPDDLVTEATGLCRRMTRHSPKLFAVLKEVVNQGNRTDLAAGLELERYAWSLAFATEDLDEGVEAFLEKRDPEYEGR